MKNKKEICDELNSIINDAVSKAYNILLDNKMLIGDIEQLSRGYSEFNKSTAMGTFGFFLFQRLEALHKLFTDRCNRIVSPLNVNELHTEDEAKEKYDEYNKFVQDIANLINSDEYKQYVKLHKKFSKFKDLINSFDNERLK